MFELMMFGMTVFGTIMMLELKDKKKAMTDAKKIEIKYNEHFDLA